MKKFLRNFYLLAIMATIGFALIGCGGGGGGGTPINPAGPTDTTTSLRVVIDNPPSTSVRASYNPKCVWVMVYDTDDNLISSEVKIESQNKDGKWEGKWEATIPDVKTGYDATVRAYADSKDAIPFFRSLITKEEIEELSSIEVNELSNAIADYYDAYRNNKDKNAKVSDIKPSLKEKTVQEIKTKIEELNAKPVVKNINVSVNTISNTEHTVTLSDLATNADELINNFDLTNEFHVAAAVFCMIERFNTDADDGKEMMDYLMGPDAKPNDSLDISFVKEQLRQYPYIVHSYLKGATVANGYNYSELTLTFTENSYSRNVEQDGTKVVKLFCECSGADSPRPLQLIQKKDSSDWLITSSTHRGGILLGIRKPDSGETVEDVTDPSKYPVKNKINVTTKDKTVTFDSIPACVEDLNNFDFTNEYQAAAAAICMLANFEDNQEVAAKMMDVVFGPEVTPNATIDISFTEEQLSRYPYVMRSYFAGATVDNGYKPTSYSLTFTEQSSSRVEEGYVKLFCESSGADSPRSITLYKQKKLNKWFVFADTYRGLLVGIREPKK